MKTFLLLALTGTCLLSCQKVTVGYLWTEYAAYQVDSLLVKSELDTTPPTIVPNPLYQLYIDYGFSPEDLLLMGILPTLSEGGGEDYDRNRLGQPWVSTAIEGIQGTMPIWVSISDISSPDGDASRMREQLSVRSNGMFTLPLQHGVPPGTYSISLEFKNEGYTKSISNVFRIVVQ